MNKNETFRDYFQRAKLDPSARAELMRTAGVSRSLFGWIALFFAAGALGTCVSHGVRSGNWLPGFAIFCSFGFVGNLLVWDKFGDRIAALKAMNDETSPPESGTAR